MRYRLYPKDRIRDFGTACSLSEIRFRETQEMNSQQRLGIWYIR